MKLTSHTTHSGVGGAHLGLFGRSLVLREGEGDGAGGTGATTPTGEPPGTGTAPGASVKTFTQEQVNAIAAQAREDGRRSAEKKLPAPAPAPQEPDGGEKLSLKQLQTRLDESEMRRAFDKRAAKLAVDDAAADDLFELYKAQKPADPQAWIDEKASRFGLTKQSTTNPNPPQLQPTEQPKPPAAPNAPNAITTAPGPDGLVNIYAMSAEQFAAVSPAKIREFHERNVDAAARSSGAPPAPRIPGLQQKR